VPRNLYLHAAKEGAKNFFRKFLGKKVRYLSYTYYYEAFYRELEHFFNCIKKGVDVIVSVEDGLETVKLIAQAYALFNKGLCEK
jgi:predicted dehydrogenase